MNKRFDSQFSAAEVEKALDRALYPDSSVSQTSERPVQSRAVYNKFRSLSTINGQSILSGDDIVIKAKLPIFSIDIDSGDISVEESSDDYDFSLDSEGCLVVNYK